METDQGVRSVLIPALVAVTLCAACGGRLTSGSASDEGDAGRPTGRSGTDGSSVSSSFPLGVYGDCSYQDSGQGTFGIGGGSTMGATLTLTQAAAELTATYSTFHESLAFAPTTGTSAALVAPGQSLPGGWSECGGGVTDAGFPISPTAGTSTLNLTSGALTYDAKTVFLSLEGTVVDAGPDCTSGQTVSVSISCSKP
jgi:hypothetical protein